MENPTVTDPKIAEQINQLRLENEVQRRTILRLEAQYGVILEQRDEARREVCYAESEVREYRRCSPQEYANRMGWDCFPETEEADANNAAFRRTDGE